MYKLEELHKFAKEFLNIQLQQSTEQMGIQLEQDADRIRKEYLDVCDRLFQKCVRQQETEGKGAVRFVYFFYLKSALLTRKHEIQINAYTKDGYMDGVETMEFWYPSFILDFYERDMQELDKAARKNVIHYGYSDYMKLREVYFPIYITFLGRYIMSEIENVVALKSFDNMQKDGEFQMVYGGYMDIGIRV